MGRRRSIPLILLSITLISATLDIRSRFVWDSYSFSHGSTDDLLSSVAGRAIVQHVTNIPPSNVRYPGYHRSPAVQASVLTSDPQIKFTHALGHSVSKVTVQGITGRIWIFTLWQLTVLAGLLPLARLYQWLVRPRGPGVCPTCGYDLRATPTLCPECGVVPAAVSK